MTLKKFVIAFLFVSIGINSWAKQEKEKPCNGKLTGTAIAMAAANDPSRAEVLTAIMGALQKIAPPGTAFEDFSSALETPPKFELGQIAFPAFKLAKPLRKAPPQIAQSLADELNLNRPAMIRSIDVVGGYLNFHIDFEAYANRLAEEIRSGEFFAPKNSNVEKISLEFSQPNTHKALHVGHMRNMFLGEAVARMLTYAGHTVVRSTYPGDLGTHVAKALWYIKTFKQADIPAEPSAEWLGRMYAEADAHVKANEEASKRGIANMLRSIESGQGDDYEFYLRTREWSLAEMREVYAWLGIHFDHWYCESECDLPSRQLVEEKFKQGLLQKSDGAIGLDLNNEGLGFVLMLKQDGTGLYLTKDLELLRRKFSDPEITRSIVVVDARQQLHFKQVFRASEIMGFDKAKNSIHLSYETVNDAQGNALSSRTLNGLTLRALKERFADPESLANLRYGFLKVAPNDQIRFDIEQWSAVEGDSAANLIRVLRDLERAADSDARVNGLLVPSEQQLVFHLGRFNQMMAKAAQNNDPSEIARYLAQLGLLIKGWDRNNSQNAGLIAFEAAQVLRKGFEILGITDL